MCSALLTVMICIALLLSAVLQPFAAEAEMVPVGDPNADPPEITSRSAAIYSYDLDQVVYEKNAGQRMDPYSITKILTCWLALENLDPDSVVTVSKKATRAYENGTTIWLQEGEEISVRDLIYGAMLESGNDAAYALGEAVAGSEARFGAMMTDQAAEWGCTDTHFVNANGWKDSKHYTTARDMCIIASHCFANEELLKISDTMKYTIPATNKSEKRKLKNYFRYTIGKVNDTNRPDAIDADADWMDEDDAKAVTGGKTGSWDEDDCSIVVCFSRRGLNGIVVLLGDTKKDRATGAGKLMDFAHEVTPGYKVSSKGDIVMDAWVKHGEKTRTKLSVNRGTIAYPPSGKSSDIVIETDTGTIEAPLKKGDKVGTYCVYVGDKLIAKRALLATEDIDTGWLPSYIYIPDKVTKIVLKVLAVLIILLLIVRTINKTRSRRRRERRRREIERRIREQERREREQNRHYRARH